MLMVANLLVQSAGVSLLVSLETPLVEHRSILSFLSFVLTTIKHLKLVTR